MESSRNHAETILSDHEVIKKYWSEMQEILNSFSETIMANLTPSQQKLVLDLKEVTQDKPDYEALCKVYYLLNEYYQSKMPNEHVSTINLQSTQPKEPFFTKFLSLFTTEKPATQQEKKEKTLLNALEKLYKKMRSDPEINWFGSPLETGRETGKIYGKEEVYNQRMQLGLAHLANLLRKGKLQCEKEMSSFPIDADFLMRYRTGQLSPDEIVKLDSLNDILNHEGCDFLTLQTTVHLYRFLLAINAGSKNPLDFLLRRDGKVPFEAELNMSQEDFLKRIESLLPQSVFTDIYFNQKAMPKRNMSNTSASDLQFSGNEKALPIRDFFNLSLSDPADAARFLQAKYRSSINEHPESEVATTPTHAGRYEDFAKKVMEIKHLQEIRERIVSGELPVYSDTQGSLVKANLDFVNHLIFQSKTGQPLSRRELLDKRISYQFRKGGLASEMKDQWPMIGIKSNVMIHFAYDSMLNKDDAKQDQMPGYSIYQHCKRLFLIALCTNDDEVRQEAFARLEWWYYVSLPYARGTPTGGEGLSKLTQLANQQIPKQMAGDVNPDLWALYHHDEEQFVKEYKQFYLQAKQGIEAEASRSYLAK